MEPPPLTKTPKHVLVRPLFCNPCCCLISENDNGTSNAMTVSWLTPLDNHKLFLLSLNAKRHTLANLRARPSFILCPYVEGMEPLALACGASSGSGAPACGKLAALGARLCAPGGAAAAAPSSAGLPALADSPAHLVCRVLGAAGLAAAAGGGGSGGGGGGAGGPLAGAAGASAAAAEEEGGLKGHVALVCQVEEAFVAARYWVEGKVFAAPSGAPRPLAFAGSKVFVAMGM